MRKYVVCFNVGTSGDGPWFEDLETKEPVADSAWQAFVTAVMERHNQGKAEDADRWTFERAYFELFDDEEVYWTATCVNMAEGQVENLITPRHRIRDLELARSRFEGALQSIKAIIEPFPDQELIPQDLDGRGLMRGLMWLRGFYEGKITTLTQEIFSAKAFHDDLLAKGKEHYSAWQERRTQSAAVAKPAAKK